MNTLKDVALSLGTSEKFLLYVLYGRQDRKEYRNFEIPKRSGGGRIISAPPRRLLWLQRLAYSHLKTYYKAKICSHGFIEGRSIVSNSEVHCQRRHVVNFDLKDFFPSIHLGRVKGVFLKPPFSFGEQAANVLAQICCTHDGVLPQGGAMSPLISNLVCRKLDNELIALAKKNKLYYTRYADDLTFSSSRPLIINALLDTSQAPPVPKQDFDKLITKNGFAINLKKVSYKDKSRRQEVTGLTVNRFPNLPRLFIRSLEGALNAWEKFGSASAQDHYDKKYSTGKGIRLSNVIRGRLAYVKMVRGKHDFLYRRLVRRFNRLAKHPIGICTLNESKPCSMNNSSSEWNVWINKYQSEIFHLVFKNACGDERSGSAFHIGRGIIATARHNIISKAGAVHNELAVMINSEKKLVGVLHEQKMSDPEPDVGALSLDDLSDRRGIPTQLRLPELGEEVAAIGFPAIPLRFPTLVSHIGTVEALPESYGNKQQRYIQVSFQSGGGLSGGCLIDKSGHVLGILVENVFLENAFNTPIPGPKKEGDDEVTSRVPGRAYGQAIPVEYLDDLIHQF